MRLCLGKSEVQLIAVPQEISSARPVLSRMASTVRNVKWSWEDISVGTGSWRPSLNISMQIKTNN